MTESIICPLWDNNDRRFQTRRYHAWDSRCGSCGRKVVISEAVKRSIDTGETAPIICEQCALTFPNESKPQIPRWQVRKGCELCSALEKQLEQARLEMYTLRELARSEGRREGIPKMRTCPICWRTMTTEKADVATSIRSVAVFPR